MQLLTKRYDLNNYIILDLKDTLLFCTKNKKFKKIGKKIVSDEFEGK